MAAYTHCPLESTAAKPSIILLRTFPFLRGLQGKRRADERTRTAYPCSLRVITQALQGCAGACKSRISKGVSFLYLAECCTVLRSRWYQSGINRGIAASRSCSVVAVAAEDEGG